MQQINETTFTAPELGDVKPILKLGGSDPSKFAPNLNMGYSFGGGEEFFDNINRTDKITNSQSDVRYDGEKVQLISGSDTDEFYTDKDGRFKWDVVFEKCPESMILEWKRTCSGGLSAYYQDSLENEWRKEPQGVSLEEYLATHNRPDDVIGSYAIYCDKANNFIKPLNVKKEIPVNWKAQIEEGAALADVNIDYYREYKTGKIGHKHRPFVIDSNGKTAWCSLLIVGNIERVTLPEDFMKSAAYPVRLDPTIGYNTKGGSSAEGSTVAFFTRFTMPENGTITSLTAYTKINASAQFKYSIYTDKDGVENINFLRGTAEGSESSYDDWKELSLTSSYDGIASTVYAFGVMSSNSSGSFYYDSGNAGQEGFDYSGKTYAQMWTNCSCAFGGALKFSIYATYTASGGSSGNSYYYQQMQM